MFALPRLYLWLGVGAAIIGVFLYIRFLHMRVDYFRGQRDQVQAILDTERAQHKQAMADMEAGRKRDLEEAQRIREQGNAHLLDRVRFHADNADALNKRLRLAAASRVRPLTPAASAPADCGNYESDPTRLSEQARGFLIGEAAAAERNGDLLEACRADYEAVKLLARCGISPQ
jgi:hypothetical protein